MITKWYTENKDVKCQSTAFAWNFRVGKNSGQCFHASAFLLRFLGQTWCSWQKQPRAELAQRAGTHLVPFSKLCFNQPYLRAGTSSTTHWIQPKQRGNPSAQAQDVLINVDVIPMESLREAAPPNASQLSLRGLFTPQHPSAVHIKSKRTAQET